MTTATGTISKSNATATPGLFLLPWISRSLEGLWLLAVFLVPLTFLDRGYSLSEAQISYVEVPKVALLRALAGLIAVLWSIEWSIKSNALQGPFLSFSISAITERLNPSKAVLAILGWVKVHPTRWLLLAAGLFFGSTVLSTVLSGSFQNSMWGEIPGQDGYSAYTIASYGIVFGVIATHLKSPAQLGRLLGAVVFMGVLVGLYGIFQYYEHDFFNLTESTGGGTNRVTIFMGNTIFAAAVLSMTVPITLVAATIHFQNENRFSWGPLFKISELTKESLSTFLWASILAVQLLGLMFTFSRGPWTGAALALAAFIGLVVISLGWRMLIRSGLVLGLASVLSVGFLHWQGNVSVINLEPSLGFVIALLGLAGTFAVLFFIQIFGRATVFIAAVGAVVAVVGLTVIAPSALSDRGNSGTVGANPGGGSTAGQVGERLSSIKSQVLGGISGGRATHWKVSWKLIKDRPWFEFDDLSLSWLRPVIGYGPDLFRYTYLLESPSDEFRFLPLEPDHAHNFFIHQTVEQGFLGGFASLALFASVLGVTVHQLLFKRNSGNPVYRILLIGLAAVLLGRFFEMAVGVARISDLTVLWVIFGLFAASVRFDGEHKESTTTPEIPVNRRARRRNRRGARNTSAGQSLGMGLLIRFAIVAWVIGGLGVITWQKSINSVRASVAEANALNHFRAGDLENTLIEFDKAIRLAPGVPSYNNNRAQVFLAYQLHADVLREPGCSQQTELPYLTCLGLESITSNLESVDYQPFYYRSRLAAGNSAFNLRMNDSAVREYTTAVGMVPNAFTARNSLAESQIDVGSYALAIENLDRSLRITGGSADSSPALFLKGRAQYAMGMLDGAEETFKHEISLNTIIGAASRSLDSLYQINTDRGVALNIEYFDRILSENPEDKSATYFRGLAHLALGNLESATTDFVRSRALGLDMIQVRANLGYSNGMLGGDPGHLGKAVNEDPANALFKAYLGNYFLSRGEFVQALDSAETAHTLDPELGLAALVRARSLVYMGLESPAKEILGLSLDSNLPGALDYIDRGQLYTHFGEFDNAFSDLNQAIRINPNQAKAYNARAKTYAIIGDSESALEDFNSAIDRGPVIGQHFRDRGVLYDILGESGRSASDFGLADSVDRLRYGPRTPPPREHNLTYFDAYKGT